jgi:hypothetical protein
MFATILKKFTKFTLATVLSFIAIVSTGYVSHAQSDLSVLSPCLPLPQNGATALAPLPRSFTLIAKVANPQPNNTGKRAVKEFMLLNTKVKGEKGFSPETTLIGIDTNQQCFNYEPLLPPFIHLTKYMPQEQARNLALQKYRWIMKQPEGKAYIQSILFVESIDYTNIKREDGRNAYVPDATYLVAEEAWALKQLGFKIPREIAIFPTQKIWQFPNDKPIRFIQ